MSETKELTDIQSIARAAVNRVFDECVDHPNEVFPDEATAIVAEAITAALAAARAEVEEAAALNNEMKRLFDEAMERAEAAERDKAALVEALTFRPEAGSHCVRSYFQNFGNERPEKLPVSTAQWFRMISAEIDAALAEE